MVAAVHTAEAACRDAGAFFSWCLLCPFCLLASVHLRSDISSKSLVEVFWIEKTKCDRCFCVCWGTINNRREVEPCPTQAGRPAGHRQGSGDASGAMKNDFCGLNLAVRILSVFLLFVRLSICLVCCPEMHLSSWQKRLFSHHDHQKDP
jgi:hypothetical protein